MEFPRQIKDVVYKLLQEPTLDKFREFLRNQTGEHNAIDFKSQWIQGSKLAKEMLAIANYGGGFLIFGVHENDDKSISCEGIPEIKDKAKISDEVKKYISSDLKYEVYDFCYTASEYPALENRNFQMMCIDDTPKFIPFMAKKDGEGLKMSEIYIRRGTACAVANQEEIRQIIDRRVNYACPQNDQPLPLQEHLAQLNVLYNNIKPKYTHHIGGFSEQYRSVFSGLAALTESLCGQVVQEPNPLYPDEGYEEFVSRMISEKKNKIERVLDLY